MAKKKRATKNKKSMEPVIIDKSKVSGTDYLIDDPKSKKMTNVTTLKRSSDGAKAVLASQGNSDRTFRESLRVYPNVTAVGRRYPRITPALRKLQ